MKQALLTSLLVGCLAASAAAQSAPRYTNAELVSLNAQTRLVVVKTTDGKQQTLQLDDTLAGFGELRACDRVILTLREGPGMTRVSSIAKSQAPAAVPTAKARKAPVAPAVAVVTANAPGLSAFSDRVAVLALQAGVVDAQWAEFTTACDATAVSSHTDGRAWFGLWEEGGAKMDVTSAPCRELFNQIIQKGEAVKVGMSQAEEAARQADLAPGDLREVRRQHAMEWGGFSLPAPEPLKP